MLLDLMLHIGQTSKHLISIVLFSFSYFFYVVLSLLFLVYRYDLKFVPFTGIDNHNRNVTFGAALLGSETTDDYRWLLRTFIKAFGKPPQVIVTDQDAAMKSAILDVLPSSRHRLCIVAYMGEADFKGTKYFILSLCQLSYNSIVSNVSLCQLCQF